MAKQTIIHQIQRVGLHFLLAVNSLLVLALAGYCWLLLVIHPHNSPRFTIIKHHQPPEPPFKPS